jgi:signal transduction histidine kinase
VPIYVALLLLGGIFGAVAFVQLRGTARTMTEVITEHAEGVFAAERMMTLNERHGRASRSFLLSGEARFLDELSTTRDEFSSMRARAASQFMDAEATRLLDMVAEAGRTYERAVDRALELRRATGSAAAVLPVLERDLQPARDVLMGLLERLHDREQRAFDEARRSALATGQTAFRLLLGAAALGSGVAAILLVVLVRLVRRLRESRRGQDEMMHRLEQTNRDLDAFAGRIAHDLRNVFAPLGMTAGRLQRIADGDPVVRTSADRIARIAARADAWTSALLAFARAGEGQGKGEAGAAAVASVPSVVEEALDSLSVQRSLVDASVEADLEDVQVACAPPLLQMALVNVLSNAFKFLEGRPERRVAILARREGPLGEIVIADTGPGIPGEAQDKVFEPFYRVDGTKAPGTGIGLATVRRIVEAHGGRVLLHSVPGEGTRFTIRLPLAERREPEPEARAAGPASVEGGADAASLRS